MHVLLVETNGIGLLYSTIGLIFGVISGFVIQTQWDNWSKLSISVHGEIKSLRQLLLFGTYISPEFDKTIKEHAETYVQKIIVNWHNNDKEKSSAEVIAAIQKLQETIYLLWDEKPVITESANQILFRIIEYHDDVTHYSSRRLPVIVKILIIFCMILVIVIPLFIGMRTLWLDYIITLSISLLAFLIYAVINDLDNPLKQGNWHITNNDYKILLEELRNNKTQSYMESD